MTIFNVSTVENHAPAGLGAALSQAVFFFDCELAAHLIAECFAYNAALARYHEQLHLYDGEIDQEELYVEFVRPVEISLKKATRRSVEVVVRGIVAGGYATSAIDASKKRIDFPLSLWRTVESSSFVVNWNNSQLLFGQHQYKQVRLRPLNPVPYLIAALATADIRGLGRFLKSRKTSADLLLIDAPLRKAIAKGFIYEEDELVTFPSDLNSNEVFSVCVDSFAPEAIAAVFQPKPAPIAPVFDIEHGTKDEACAHCFKWMKEERLPPLNPDKDREFSVDRFFANEVYPKYKHKLPRDRFDTDIWDQLVRKTGHQWGKLGAPKKKRPEA